MVATEPQCEIKGQRKCEKEKEVDGQRDVQPGEGADKCPDFEKCNHHTPRRRKDDTEFHFQTNTTLCKLTPAVTSQADNCQKVPKHTILDKFDTAAAETLPDGAEPASPEAARVHLKPSPTKTPQLHEADHLNLSTESTHIT